MMELEMTGRDDRTTVTRDGNSGGIVNRTTELRRRTDWEEKMER